MKFFKKRKDITRDNGDIYLKRWNLFECKFFSVKLHNIILSDYDCHHDHPWSFISFIIKGGYVEYKDGTSKIIHPFSLLWRPAKTSHRLELHQPCWSLVITFKKTRQWGFFTKEGWVPWFKYNSTQSCE